MIFYDMQQALPQYFYFAQMLLL